MPVSHARNAISQAISPGEANEDLRSTPVRVLLVSPFDGDHLDLEMIVQRSRWERYAARTCREALAILEHTPISVIICESDLPDGTWKALHNYLLDLPNPPTLIVTSQLVDAGFWSEAIHLGAYSVLAKPFDRQEVLFVGSLAWRHWRSRLEPSKPRSQPGPGKTLWHADASLAAEALPAF